MQMRLLSLVTGPAHTRRRKQHASNKPEVQSPDVWPATSDQDCEYEVSGNRIYDTLIDGQVFHALSKSYLEKITLPMTLESCFATLYSGFYLLCKE